MSEQIGWRAKEELDDNARRHLDHALDVVMKSFHPDRKVRGVLLILLDDKHEYHRLRVGQRVSEAVYETLLRGGS